jgi:DNA polymerase III sliding clamp (beta) subunit (PCNA family)
MHVVISETDKFQAALSRAASNVSKSDSNPIQSALKLWTKSNKLMITALDTTSHQLTLSVNATVQVEGSVLIEAEHFSKVMSKFGDQLLSLDNNPGSGDLNIKIGKDNLDFNLFSAEIDDFPMEKSLPPKVASVSGETLADFTKSLLNGTLNKEQDISFTTIEDKDKLRGYVGDATSGLLIRTECALKGKDEDFHVKIPYLILKRLPLFTGDVNIHYGNGLFVFAKDEEHFIVRVADTEDDSSALDYIFDKAPLGLIAIRQLDTFKKKLSILRVSKATQVAKLMINSDANILSMSAFDFSHGNMLLEVGLGDVQGQTPSLLFDSSCLDRAASAIDTESAVASYILHETDDTDIWVLKMYDESSPASKQAVILPIQE